MKRIVVLGLASSVFFAWLAPRTRAQVGPQNVTNSGQLVLYDSLNGPRIDPNKWTGIWGDFSDMREMVREITWPAFSWGHDRALRVSMRSYANDWSDEGGLGGPFGLLFTQPAGLTEVAFTVTVRAAEATGCASNAGMSAAVAEFRGAFFNDGTGRGDATGDVVAAITVNRYGTDMGGPLAVDAFYSRCDDQYCATQSTLGWGRLGYVYAGQPARLHVKWDQPSHQFAFQLNRQLAFVSQYAVSDTTPPSYGGWKYVGLTRVLPNCTSSPRPTAMMDAYFSDVFVNPQ
jgi:hypothetical protein